jgi:hypothetical protein
VFISNISKIRGLSLFLGNISEKEGQSLVAKPPKMTNFKQTGAEIKDLDSGDCPSFQEMFPEKRDSPLLLSDQLGTGSAYGRIVR